MTGVERYRWVFPKRKWSADSTSGQIRPTAPPSSLYTQTADLPSAPDSATWVCPQVALLDADGGGWWYGGAKEVLGGCGRIRDELRGGILSFRSGEDWCSCLRGEGRSGGVYFFDKIRYTEYIWCYNKYPCKIWCKKRKFGVKNAIIFILPMVQKLHKFLCSLCGTQYGHIFNTTVFNFLE
jgi:hypothetical protein